MIYVTKEACLKRRFAGSLGISSYVDEEVCRRFWLQFCFQLHWQCDSRVQKCRVGSLLERNELLVNVFLRSCGILSCKCNGWLQCALLWSIDALKFAKWLFWAQRFVCKPGRDETGFEYISARLFSLVSLLLFRKDRRASQVASTHSSDLVKQRIRFCVVYACNWFYPLFEFLSP